MRLLQYIAVGFLIGLGACGEESVVAPTPVDSNLKRFKLTAESTTDGVQLKWDTSLTPDAVYSVQRSEETGPLKKSADLDVGVGEWFDTVVYDYLVYRYLISAKIGSKAVGSSNSEYVQYFSFPITQSDDYSTAPDTFLREPDKELIFSSTPYYLPVTSNQSRTTFLCTTQYIVNPFLECPSQMQFNKLDEIYNQKEEGSITYFIKAKNVNGLVDDSPLPVTFLGDFNPPKIRSGNLEYKAATNSEPAELSFVGYVEDSGTFITLDFSGDITHHVEALESQNLFGTPVTLPVPDRTGDTTIKLKVSDQVGHTATATCTIKIGSETKGPDCF